ncbi:methyltransferase family protein [Murinocardiopsis flavida]|uniref:Methyltransferase family protein n=1 Tax=Murinocardiopsis flavida TaxID=645275 RepID=A0A2P8DNI7_9ACTN|nr:class I SAM-dependent methyltransferase [Murinocardiopsis flavida]PSK98786.1 methyltransferase family protein [Murinocardiopsis flavida]
MPQGPADGREALRAAMYGADDLSSFALFSGSYINFGYWDRGGHGLADPLTVAERTLSQQDMYRAVAERLDIGPGHRLLEAGCGIGVGAALVLNEFAPAAVYGVDLSGEQVDRAWRVNTTTLEAHPGRLGFQRASALDLPWPDSSFDAVYSVEAAQHFDDLARFAAEARRVLRPGGRLAVATFFATGEGGGAALAELIETVRSGVDVLHPVAGFTADLRAAGFTGVRADAIGEHVWPYFDAWIAHTEYRDTWGRNWLRAYREGLVDYHLVTATG